MIVLFRLSLNDLCLFPTEGMIGVFAYLVTCWPDCGKKIEVCALRNGNRTEEKMELSSLISCHWLSVHLPFFCEIPSFSIVSPPLTPPCFCFGTSLFGFLPKKIRGCGSPRATNPLVPCHPFSMQLVWIASTKCRDLYRLVNRYWIFHSSMFREKMGAIVMTKIKVPKCGRTRCCPYRVLLSHFVVTGVCVTEPVRKCNHMLLIVSSLT